MKNKELFTIRIFDLLNIIFNIIIVFFIARGRWINIHGIDRSIIYNRAKLKKQMLTTSRRY